MFIHATTPPGVKAMKRQLARSTRNQSQRGGQSNDSARSLSRGSRLVAQGEIRDDSPELVQVSKTAVEMESRLPIGRHIVTQ
jgi:hypothetical protein